MELVIFYVFFTFSPIICFHIECGQFDLEAVAPTLNQEAEPVPKLSRNCCVNLDRSVGFNGLQFWVL